MDIADLHIFHPDILDISAPASHGLDPDSPHTALNLIAAGINIADCSGHSASDHDRAVPLKHLIVPDNDILTGPIHTPSVHATRTVRSGNTGGRTSSIANGA